MAKKTVSKYEFSGSPIDDLIGYPLVAMAKAQSMMAKEQLRSLLEICFNCGSNGVYEPKLLQMMVTRSMMKPGNLPGDLPDIVQESSFFYVPVITIFPISSLGIDNAEFDFSIELTSQRNTYSDKEKNANTKKNYFATESEIGLLGKISTLPMQKRNEDPVNGSGSVKVNVETKTIPLSKGLLEILSIYSNAMMLADSNK